MFIFFLVIIAEMQELPPVCVAFLLDVLYKPQTALSYFSILKFSSFQFSEYSFETVTLKNT